MYYYEVKFRLNVQQLTALDAAIGSVLPIAGEMGIAKVIWKQDIFFKTWIFGGLSYGHLTPGEEPAQYSFESSCFIWAWFGGQKGSSLHLKQMLQDSITDEM